MSLTTSPVGAVRIARVTLRELVESVADGSYAGPRHLHFTNAYSVVCAHHDELVAEALCTGACLPDGLPLVWSLRRLYPDGGWVNAERVRGPDTFPAVLAATQGKSTGRHFLLGSTPGVLAKLQEAITRRFPGAEIVGAVSPPFAPVDEIDWESQLSAIRASGAALVWVGLGTPKQDLVAQLLSDRDPDRLYFAVGAAFDFVAGTQRVAPGWMQRRGLEWLFRLISEPRRLWRRYLIGNIEFIAIVTAQWFRIVARRRTG